MQDAENQGSLSFGIVRDAVRKDVKCARLEQAMQLIFIFLRHF